MHSALGPIPNSNQAAGRAHRPCLQNVGAAAGCTKIGIEALTMTDESKGAWKSGLCDLYSLDAVMCCRICWTPCYPYGEIASTMTPEVLGRGGEFGGFCALQLQCLMGYIGFGVGNAYSVCCCFWLYCLRDCDIGHVAPTVAEVATCIAVPLVVGFTLRVISLRSFWH